MGLILNGSYGGELLTTLVNLYKGHSTPDFVQMSQCLIFLDEPLAVADVLEKLSNGKDAPIPITKVQQNDEPTYYLRAMKIFMEFIREENFRISLVTETMSRHTFHYIHQQIDNYRENFEHEKKNRPKYLMWGRSMHLAIKAYQELLLCLLTVVHMKGSKDDAVREEARV